jgi:hypothetical protein
MRLRTPILSLATILLACYLLGPISQLGYAFKCKPAGTPLEELKEAAAVFVGKVTKVDESGAARVTEFEVERYWKGPGRKVITVRSGKHLYGYRFATGGRYLVYAYGKEEIETSRCSRTKGIESAAYDLKELGEGKMPQ